MTRTGFEHHRTGMAGLTYSHYTSLGAYAFHLFHTLYYNLYRNTFEKGHL